MSDVDCGSFDTLSDSDDNRTRPRDRRKRARSRSRSRSRERDREDRRKSGKHEQSAEQPSKQSDDDSKHDPMPMPLALQPADLSADFTVLSEEERDLLQGHQRLHVVPAVMTKKVYEVNTHTNIEDYKCKLKLSTAGKYIRLPSLNIDNLIVSIAFFPKGHIINPSGAQRFQTRKISIGVSILNALDVYHRLKRFATSSVHASSDANSNAASNINTPHKLEVDLRLGGGDANTFQFDLREFVKQCVVFRDLPIEAKSKRLNNVRKIHVTARIIYDAWDRHTEDRDDYRLKLYRLGLRHGKVTLHLMQPPPAQAGNDSEQPSVEPLPLPPVRLDVSSSNSNSSVAPALHVLNSIKIGEVALMAGAEFARIMWTNMPTDIGIYAPTIVHLNALVFYCCTGVMHDISDAKWFLRLAKVTSDDRMLHDAAALCLQRLDVSNVLNTVRVFHQCKVPVAHGLLDLERWIDDHQQELDEMRLEEKNSKDVSLYEACKNVDWRSK